MTSSSTSVVRYDPSRRGEWEEYVRRSPVTGVAHDLRWRSVVEETYGHRSFYLMAYREGRVVGVLPLFLVRSLIFGRFLVSAPYLSHGGVVSNDEEAATALIREAEAIGREHRVDYLEARSLQSFNAFSDTKTVYCSMILDLSPGEDALWRGLQSRKERQSINKARRHGLDVVEGLENIDAFIDLHNRGMHRLGTPDHGRGFFDNVAKYFPDSKLILARHEGTPIGGTLSLRHKETLEGVWATSLQQYFYMQPNNFLYWETICRASREGLRFIDFGRSKWDSGTFRFKQSFGAQARPLYYQFSLNRARAVPHVDPDNSCFKPLIAVWRRLPFAVARAMGSMFIRDIP